MIKWVGNGGHYRAIMGFFRVDSSDDGWFIAVGNNSSRKREAEAHAGPFAIIVAGDARMAPDVKIGAGTVVMPGVVLMAGARIGKHCIINTGATVDHDCIIEDYAHIAPGAHLCGGVHVGEGALVGVGVGIEPGVKIPAWSIVKRIPYVITLASG